VRELQTLVDNLESQNHENIDIQPAGYIEWRKCKDLRGIEEVEVKFGVDWLVVNKENHKAKQV
jgi:hypothetical protein